MSLKPCIECGQSVSTRAARCPRCGLKNPTTRVEANAAPLLFSSRLPEGRAVPCRECRGQVRRSTKVCPYCGLRNPARRPLPQWMLPAGIALIFLLPVGVIVQQVVEMGPAGIESGLLRGAVPPPPQVAGATTSQFTEQCVNPAPVRVLAGGTPPAGFFVRLAARDNQEAARLATTLARKYQLSTSGYQRSKRGFAAVLPPEVIHRLRCEGSVTSIEDDRRVGSRRRAAAGTGLAPAQH
jgi:RNA polymerase subunit RPABC4/transcription elongation factor Spt4